MLQFIIPFLQIDVNEKLKNAPDDSYQTGIIIGSLLPFVLLVGIAWFVYYKAKNRKDLDE
jgi:hypothetical protein